MDTDYFSEMAYGIIVQAALVSEGRFDIHRFEKDCSGTFPQGSRNACDTLVTEERELK
jgi:hypothetical protein